MLMVERYREECDQDVVSIMYFFSDNIQSQRQGNVLTEFREANQGQVFVFSFDMESDNTSAVNMIKQDHNVTATPTLVINQDRKLEGYTPQSELRQTVQEYINLDDGDS
jgi:predicted DsbA family dithiol-disulfide isomerase